MIIAVMIGAVVNTRVQNIMRSVVAPRTALNYALRNACLVLYHFET